jgi:Domain of unknown function (DUF1835)
MLGTEVHIVAGPSAAACLQDGLALSPDNVLVHHDLLSCGPLPVLDSLDDWRDVRESYLRSLDIEGPSLSFAEQDRDLLTNRERLRSAETITLWLGTGLAEQLMLVWVIALLRKLGADAGRCRIVQFNLDRKHEVVAVGVLDPLRFKEHPPPTGLTEGAIQEATTAWEAVTAPEPDDLLAFLAHRQRSLPFLQRALSSLLYHYPDHGTGLNAWEYQLLQYVRDEGPKATRAIGYTMGHDMDFPEWMADSYLFQRLHHLGNSALPRPLLTLSGDTKQMRGTEARLTNHGEAILAGKGNAVEWNGIDDWVGGVHLDSRNGRVWFHREQTLVPGA